MSMLSNKAVEIQEEAFAAYDYGVDLNEAVDKYRGTIFEQTFVDAYNQRADEYANHIQMLAEAELEYQHYMNQYDE